jgi:hypothetical protein
MFKIFLLMAFTANAVSQYSDEFARRKFWTMTAVPYSNNRYCTDLCFNSYEYLKTVEVNCDLMKNGSDTCAGAAVASNDDKAIILTFRGTTTNHQLNEEMNSLWDKVPFPGGGNVSHYFYNAFLTVWNGGVRDDFTTFKNRHSDYEVWVTGHSLGAIMASLAAGHISALGFVKPEKIKLIAFAGPHGGDQIWADKMTTLVPYAYRVVHANDLVPHMPFDVHPEWQYTHHTKEIWYNNTMDIGASFIECDEQESSKCSNSVPKKLWTWNDHSTYFLGGDRCKLWCQKSRPSTSSP